MKTSHRELSSSCTLERITGNYRILTQYQYTSTSAGEKRVSSTQVYLRKGKKEELVYVHPTVYGSVGDASNGHRDIIADVMSHPDKYTKRIEAPKKQGKLENKVDKK